jgi:peptide/nickel transport system substrate-binding protein
MIDSFIDVNGSQVLSESEFSQILSQGLDAVYHGRSVEVKSMQELLKVFNYNGPTAGVVKLKLKFPYSPILHVLTTGVASVFPMEYALGDKYDAAIRDSNNGKNPSAWANYVVEGEEDETYKILKDRPVSTGPYYVADYKEDAYIILKINPYYWNATIWEQLYGVKP